MMMNSPPLRSPCCLLVALVAGLVVVVVVVSVFDATFVDETPKISFVQSATFPFGNVLKEVASKLKFKRGGEEQKSRAIGWGARSGALNED